MAKSAIKIDAKPFIKFCEHLKNSLPTDMTFGEVFEQETLSALRTCARKIKRTTVAKAGGKYNPRSKHFKGWVRMNGKFYYVGPTQGGNEGFRYSNSMWNKLMARMKTLRERAETRVALSKASFFLAAKKLNLRGYSKGWPDDAHIKSAMNKSGGIGSAGRDSPIWSKVANGKKNLKGKNPQLEFTISSTNTFNPFTGDTGIVESSFRGRQKNFETAVKKGMMESTKKIAKQYPNIKVK